MTADDRIYLGRPNWVEVDASRLRDNVRTVRGTLGPEITLFAALKANAYGFGLIGAARAFSEGDIDGFSMADLGDAIALRLAGLAEPILLYGGGLVDAAYARAIVDHDIQPTIHDHATATGLKAHLPRPVPVFVKVDCGLERLGIPAEVAAAFITNLVREDGLDLGGVYTHLHVPKAPGNVETYVAWQIGRFRGVVEQLESNAIRVPLAIVESTGVINVGARSGFHGADPGHILYGIASGGPILAEPPVQSALVGIKSRLIQVRDVDRPAYGNYAPFRVEQCRKVGVIPFGLRDGIAGLLIGEAIVRGHRVRILAQPSLEHTRLDLTTVPDATVGDEVVLVGAQNGACISPETVLERCGHGRITDFLIAVPPTVARLYLNDGTSQQR